MAWVAVDANGEENIFSMEPYRTPRIWYPTGRSVIELPKGSIEKLLGKVLTWENEPVELK